MQRYVGTKVINAKAMTRQEYNNFKGWTLPENENGNDAGYLVRYIDTRLAEVDSNKPYVSWSPKEIFEASYKMDGDLDFGAALTLLRQGKKVARTGWNGSDMYVYLVPAASYPAITRTAKEAFGEQVPYRAYLALKTAQNDVATWAPSCSDALAQDWLEIY